jgi:hypothetical protein
MLTVIYQELTEEGKPRFPVGKDVRDNYWIPTTNTNI